MRTDVQRPDKKKESLSTGDTMHFNFLCSLNYIHVSNPYMYREKQDWGHFSMFL